MEIEIIQRNEHSTALAAPAVSSVLAAVAPRAQGLLARMFADPYLLSKEDRAELVQGLRNCVAAYPNVSELRVLFGMSLCVDLKVQDAIEELKEGVRLAPDSFIAHLKMGELWMRLRVCDKAEHHTQRAALLAQSSLHSELARQQAKRIRELVRHGVKRGGPGERGSWRLIAGIRRIWGRKGPSALATTETP